jgi:hypothetical protein
MVAVLGAIIGIIYMTSFPALAMASPQEVTKFIEGKEGAPVRPGEVFFFKGPIMRTTAWEATRTALLEGSDKTVDLTHAELNGWLSAKFKPGAAPTGEDSSGILIMPGVPNIYIDADVIHFSIPADLTIIGTRYACTVLGTGRIADVGNVLQFEIETVHIDSAKVPYVGLLGIRIVDTLLKAYSSSAEFIAMQDAWSRVESFEQSRGVVRLQLR